MKIIVLFLQYDAEKYPCALHYFKKYLNLLNNCEITIITIDNKIEMEYFKQISGNEIIINGDNTLWEFSGWQKGLEYIYKNNIEYDGVIFVNDAFLAPAGGGSDLSNIINDLAIKKCISKNMMVGQLAGENTNEFIGKIFISNYFRTHCFMLSKKIIETIQVIPTIDKTFLDMCINTKPSKKIFKKDSPLSRNLEKILILHITKWWHSKINIQNNWDLFRMKVLAILNEMLLTAKIRGYLIKIE
jgi:hypothetical protein